MRRGWIACAALLVGLVWLLSRARDGAPAAAPLALRAPAPTLPGDGPVEPGAEVDARSAAPRTPQPGAPAPVAPATPERAATPTRLSLRVLEPDGSPWARGSVVLELLSADGASELLRNPAPDFPDGTRVTVSGSIGSFGGRRIFALGETWTTDGGGAAELPGIPPGVPFAIRAVDDYGFVGGRLEGAPLAPGEVREAELWLARKAWPVTGRCVDADGTPLVHVRVAVEGEAEMREQTSDAEGRFAWRPVFADTLVLSARRRGFVRVLQQVLLPGPPVELVLQRARTLRVTLVDPDGAPFVLQELRAHSPSEDPRVDTFPELREDSLVFESMPPIPVTLAIEGCGGRPTLEVDADTDEVRWTLPRPGMARFEWAANRQALGGRIEFELVRVVAGAPEPVERRWVPRGQPIPEWRLFPGRYRLQVLCDGPEAVGELRPLGAPRTFDVRAGEATQLLVGD